MKKLPQHMHKPLKKMLLIMAIIFGCILIYKIIMNLVIKHFFAEYSSRPLTVSTAKATHAEWQPNISAVGSVRAVRGVNVTCEVGGIVKKIYFKPGDLVDADTLLLEQNIAPNLAKLHALQASFELSRITYTRDKAQLQAHGISQQQLDADYQNMQNFASQVEEQQATVDQLLIKAPFKGRLGISQVNLGQYLNPGDTIVTLQDLHNMYIDFNLPQQNLADLFVHQEVIVTTDGAAGESFKGFIRTINPLVDKTTRNIAVEAEVPNPDEHLLPGMFVNVTVNLKHKQKSIVVPESAITYNPYGNIVYQLLDNKTVKQIFVTTGPVHGHDIVVLNGIHAGDEVVTSGQLKLKNGSSVVVNNSVQPFDVKASLNDEHQ